MEAYDTSLEISGNNITSRTMPSRMGRELAAPDNLDSIFAAVILARKSPGIGRRVLSAIKQTESFVPLSISVRNISSFADNDDWGPCD